jgi:hypothetical protein
LSTVEKVNHSVADAISHGPNGVTQNQIQSLSVSLAQQSVNRAHLSTSLNIPEDITDDASLTLTHNSEQDINNVDNFSDVSESQSIDINSINLNNHTSNDCESPSDFDNIATRVKAKYSKARQKRIHKKSQESNTRRRNNIYNQTCKRRKTQTRNLDVLSPSESLSIEY